VNKEILFKYILITGDDWYIYNGERKMKRVKAILLTLILLFTLVGCSNKTSGSGTVKVELVDLDGSVIKVESIKFDSDDTLKELIEDEFDNVVFENGMLMEIENYKTPSDWKTFISVYVDGKMSMVGISDIKLVDNMVVSLTITEFVS
jgi:hypothetical protein